MLNKELEYPEDPSKPGEILIAMDELQKTTHELEKLTNRLRGRLTPVLRDDDRARLDPKSSSTPEPPRSPLDSKLRLIGSELRIISANMDNILKLLEL